MNFNSPDFLIFLPVVLGLYALVYRHERLRDVLLLAASYLFYMTWNWKYGGLLALSTVVDYGLARLLSRETDAYRRRVFLTLSLTLNLGILAIFKYFNFFIGVTEGATSLFGVPFSGPRLDFLLPVGISFYTFQTLSYTIDVYRREIPVERSLLKFALFVSFFPQLVAGPIVRASVFLPQLHREPDVSARNVHDGLWLIFKGLFKKIVIADLLAGLAVDRVFADPSSFSSWDLLLGLYGYAFQIYNDFSGYSDIAIGAALMFGYRLPINFDRPYLAQNIREFWTRWHITLSTWLKDYLYVPLGGNRGSSKRVKFNLMVTMLLGGLWHGAALNFVLWGAYHGLLLLFARKAVRRPEETHQWRRIANRLVCFHLVLVSWLLFRVESMEHMRVFLAQLSRFESGTALSPVFYSVLALAVLAHVISRDYVRRIADAFVTMPAPVQAFTYAALLLMFSGLTLGAPSFIYFQF